MDLETLKKYCLAKKQAYGDYPFGPQPLVIKVFSKMFALISVSGDKTSISLKCDPFVAQNFREQFKSITPGYHMNKEHWNSVLLDGTVPVSEVFWMIDHSYELVLKGLTKEEKASLSSRHP